MLWMLVACAATWTKEDSGPIEDSHVPDTTPTYCGYTPGGDCDDNNTEIGPNCPEVCDGVDNNCDGQIDEGWVQTWYEDADGDGWGDAAVSTLSCDPGEGWVFNGYDCSPTASAVNPAADEVCDGVDNDCDGLVDPDSALDARRWYPDGDGDGYGDSTAPYPACAAPEGYVDVGGDCVDSDGSVLPGAEDVEGDGIDQDCDGMDG